MFVGLYKTHDLRKISRRSSYSRAQNTWKKDEVRLPEKYKPVRQLHDSFGTKNASPNFRLALKVVESFFLVYFHFLT